MWISTRRLWLGAAVLWSTVVCIASGVVVDADSEEGRVTDLLPVVLAPEEEQSERGGSPYDLGMIGGPVHSVDEDAEVSYDPDDLSCTELRSRRYISDGFCTSVKPITEKVCTGECVPKTVLDWGADFRKVWATTKTKYWRCVNDLVRHRRVNLVCNNNETRTYRIRTVRSCKCKRYNNRQNVSKQQNMNESPAEDGHTEDGRRHKEERNERRQNSGKSNRRRDREKRLARSSTAEESPISI